LQNALLQFALVNTLPTAASQHFSYSAFCFCWLAEMLEAKAQARSVLIALQRGLKPSLQIALEGAPWRAGL
jgi:hypothetical protein